MVTTDGAGCDTNQSKTVAVTRRLRGRAAKTVISQTQEERSYFYHTPVAGNCGADS